MALKQRLRRVAPHPRLSCRELFGPARLSKFGPTKAPELRLGSAFEGRSDCMPKSPDPTDKHVGTRVRMRRLMLGVSQTKLADALRISFQQVQKYEKGVNRISASKLQQISDFLEVPVPFFFESIPGLSNKPAKTGGVVLPDDVFQFMATNDGLSLAQSFTRISRPQLRRCIVSLVEDLATTASR